MSALVRSKNIFQILLRSRTLGPRSRQRFPKNVSVSAGARNFKSLASTNSATSAPLIWIAFSGFSRKCFPINPCVQNLFCPAINRQRVPVAESAVHP